VDVLGLREPQADLAGLEGAVAAVAARFGVVGSDTSAALAALVVARSAARSDRDFARADGIRDALGEVGVVLEDGPDGTTWHRR
jgi:cysteinyl-tRNA synthetase